MEDKDLEQWLTNFSIKLPSDAPPELITKLTILKDSIQKKQRAAELEKEQIIEENQIATSENQRYNQLLSTFHLSYDELNPTIQDSLNILSELAFQLDCKSPGPSDIVLRFSELLIQNSEWKNNTKKEQEIFNDLSKQIHESNIHLINVSKILNNMNSSLENLQKDTNYYTSNLQYLIKKTQSYKQTISQLQTQLNNIHYSPNCTHQSVQKLRNQVMDLEEKISPLMTKIQSYHELPPDITLTHRKIIEAQSELEYLQSDFEKKCQAINLEI